MQVTTDELIHADEAFADNQLLSTFPREARALIEPYGTMVELNTGETAQTRGEQVTSTLFPIGPTLISLEIELSGGRTAEALVKSGNATAVRDYVDHMATGGYA